MALKTYVNMFPLLVFSDANTANFTKKLKSLSNSAPLPLLQLSLFQKLAFTNLFFGRFIKLLDMVRQNQPFTKTFHDLV